MVATTDITNAVTAGMDTIAETAVTPLETTGVGEGKETTYTNDLWPILWGYFNQNPELKSAELIKSIWNVGKGFTTDKVTQGILNNIRGYGKDTFEDILFNMDLIKNVGRDSFAEIIRDDSGALLNIKPLDPSNMRIVFNDKGIIERYEQTAKKGLVRRALNMKAKTIGTPFKPHQIFHLSNNRLADQIHGISDIESLEPTILAELESFDDTRKVVHRQAKPFIIFKLKTDDKPKIDALVAKIKDIRKKGDDLFIPDDENILSWEVVQVNPSQVILEWRNDIRNKFYRAILVPQIMAGAGGQGTESDSKIIMFGSEQVIWKNQRYLERQIKAQLGLDIDLIHPTSVAQDLQQDEAKDKNQGIAIEPADTKVGVGA